jgi:hypothetical protein
MLLIKLNKLLMDKKYKLNLIKLFKLLKNKVLLKIKMLVMLYMFNKLNKEIGNILKIELLNC